MLKLLSTVVLLLAAVSASANGVGHVQATLQTQKATLLATLQAVEADDPAAVLLHEEFAQIAETFEQLGADLGSLKAFTVAKNKNGSDSIPNIAFATADGYVFVSKSVAQLPEETRYFVLAHELAHVVKQHQAHYLNRLLSLVTEATSAQEEEVLVLRHFNSLVEQMHRNEFEADAIAMRMMEALDVNKEPVFAYFTKMSALQSATHPATADRVRAMQARTNQK